ncbi:MAG TPA: bacteriocin-protection protein, partial [Blastocatellia bacterium]|nr:bacteriocin-protection protein [Blastocatellia bacterium]
MKPAGRAPKTDLPVMFFSSQKDLAKWLDKNHSKSPGIWLKIAKKGSGIDSVSYTEAIDVALCYGWIDGQ